MIPIPIELFKSEEDKYNRYVLVYHSKEICMKCGGSPAIEIDTSDTEYLSATFCQPCLTAFFSQPQPETRHDNNDL